MVKRTGFSFILGGSIIQIRFAATFMQKTVGANTIYLISAFVGQKLLAFVYFTLIARFVGVEDTGAYVFALSYTSFFAVFVDLGLNSTIIREVARRKEDAAKILQTVIATKLGLNLLTLAGVALSLPLLNKSPELNAMVYLASLLIILDSFSSAVWAVFRGFQNLKYEAMGLIGGQVMVLLVGVLSIWQKWPTISFIFAVMAGSVFQLLASLVLLKLKLRINVWPRWDKQVFGQIFKVALPFALSGVFTRFYSYLDQIMLSVMSGEKALGWYSVPYKITFAFQFIPQSLGAALFPAMSDYYINSREKLATAFERAVFYLTIVSLPASVGVGLLARPVILTVYGNSYEPAVLALQIMIAGLLFVFLSFPVGAILNAANRQTQQTMNLGLTLLVNASLNAILIPRYGFIGSSIAILVSMGVLFFSGLYWVDKITPYDKKKLFAAFIKSLLSSAAMGVIIWGILPYLPFEGRSHMLAQILVSPIIGGAVYAIAMFLIGGIKLEDVLYVKRAFSSRNRATAA